MYLIFDTETTGLPRNFNAPITDTSNWPRVVQLAWQLHDELGNVIEHKDFLVKPNDLSKVNLAFFTTNGIASAIFGTLVIIDLLT
jgi:hypothetical protein